jgi:hypothetical protein
MADFQAMLALCGFNPPTVAYLNANGLNAMDDLRAIPLSSIDEMMKQLQKDRPEPQRNAPPVTLSFVPVRRLKAVRLWQEYRGLRGQDSPPNAVTNEVVQAFLERLIELEQFKEEDSAEREKPPELKSFSAWRNWDELFRTYIRRLRSAEGGIPLIYLIRELDVPTQEMLDAQYASIDEDLIATRQLQGASYGRDNARLFDIMKPLLLTGPGWPYLHTMNRTQNGRAAYLSLQAHAEGQASTLTRRTKAYNDIGEAVYTGKNARFTFDAYAAKHVRAHNELEVLGEPVAETKKVTDFVNGIQDQRLEIAKLVVDGDPEKHSNFDICLQYFKTVVEKAAARSGGTRSVAKVGTKQGDGKRKNRGGQGRPGKKQQTQQQAAKKKQPQKPAEQSNQPRPKLHTGYYSNAEYRSLTDEEKDEIKRMREAASLTREQSQRAAVPESRTVINEEYARRIEALNQAPKHRTAEPAINTQQKKTVRIAGSITSRIPCGSEEGTAAFPCLNKPPPVEKTREQFTEMNLGRGEKTQTTTAPATLTVADEFRNHIQATWNERVAYLKRNYPQPLWRDPPKYKPAPFHGVPKDCSVAEKEGDDEANNKMSVETDTTVSTVGIEADVPMEDGKGEPAPEQKPAAAKVYEPPPVPDDDFMEDYIDPDDLVDDEPDEEEWGIIMRDANKPASEQFGRGAHQKK